MSDASSKIQWSSPNVFMPLAFAIAFAIAFVYVELRIAPEPVLAPFLLRQKIPVLVGISNFLVSMCNFTVMYNFPTWFQTVMLTSASEAGEAQVYPHKYLSADTGEQAPTSYPTVSPCRAVLSLPGKDVHERCGEACTHI